MSRKERIEELTPMLERLTDPVFASVHTLVTVLAEFSEKPMSVEEAEAIKADKPAKAVKKTAKREVKVPIEDFDEDVTSPVIETMEGEDIEDFDLNEEMPPKEMPKEVKEDMDIFEEEPAPKSAPVKKETLAAKPKAESIPDDFDDDFDAVAKPEPKKEVKKEEPKKEVADDFDDDFDF